MPPNARRSIAVVALLWSALAAAVPAMGAEDGFSRWLEGVRAEALARGIGPATVGAALDGVAPIPRVVELDRHQPEFTLTFPQYMARVVPEKRVRRGRALLAEHRALLASVAAKHRVQARFIVALWGSRAISAASREVSTSFQRSPRWRSTVAAARSSEPSSSTPLTILDQGHITVDRMTGSWAGAMGQPQFMPSSFVRFAVDHDGDGRIDIWTTLGDVFASAANYLARSGWRDDITWGRQVRLPAGFDRANLGLKVAKRLPEWQRIGVRRADGSDLPTRPLAASVIVAEEGKGPAFVVYDNFHAILKWNRSSFFALAVGHLADRLARG